MAFESFPSTVYDLTAIRNYYFNVDFYNSFVKDSIDSNSFDYVLEHGDTPESLSMKYFGTDTYWYMILIANNIRDPFYEWNLTDEELMNYAKEYVENNFSTLALGNVRRTIDTIIKQSLTDIASMVIKKNSETYNTYKEVVKQLIDLGAYFNSDDVLVVPSEESGGKTIIDSDFINNLYNDNIEWYWKKLFSSDEMNLVVNAVRVSKTNAKSFNDIFNILFDETASNEISTNSYIQLREIVAKARDLKIDEVYTQLLSKNRIKIKIPTQEFMAQLSQQWEQSISNVIAEG